MDTRRRTLAMLGAAALVFAALAGVALVQRAQEGAHRTTPQIFLPGFEARAKDAARIEIAGHDASFAVVLTPQGWVLPASGDYPANFNEVRQTLITLAQLTTIGPRTSRPDWLHYLSLDAPPKGTGTRLTVKDAHGAVLADLIFGNVEEQGTGTAIFVRHPGDNQAWLAKAVFALHGARANWIQAGIFDMGPGRLQEVVVTPPDGPGYTVGRLLPSQPVSVLTPKGGTPDFQVINDLGFAVAGFTITDVRPVSQIDFKGATLVSARSFDGLAVNLAVVQQGQDYWAHVSAEPAPKTPQAIVQEAAAITARGKDWAFLLPPEKGQVLLTSLKRLMTPPPPRMGTIAPPGEHPQQ